MVYLTILILILVFDGENENLKKETYVLLVVVVGMHPSGSTPRLFQLSGSQVKT